MAFIIPSIICWAFSFVSLVVFGAQHQRDAAKIREQRAAVVRSRQEVRQLRDLLREVEDAKQCAVDVEVKESEQKK